MLSMTFEEAVAPINVAISEARPFSLIRLGDSENSILGYPEHTKEPRIQSVLSRLMDAREYSPAEVLDIKSGLVEAVNGADIVGLFPADHPKELCALSPAVLQSAGVQIELTCWQSIHFYLAASGHLARMVYAADRVTLITGRDIKARFDERFGCDVEQLLVPSERKFRLNEENGRGEHYPTVYRAIRAAIEVRAPRHLFLVGAGVLGKAYCQAIKEAGGIAVDVGSVFDYWAGLATREKKTPADQVVADGVATNLKSAKSGLGLDDTPSKMSVLREVYWQGFNPPDLRRGGPFAA